MRKRPVLLLACVFLLGICRKEFGNIVIPAAILLWGYFCLPLFKKRKWRRIAFRSSVCAAVFVIGALHMQAACDFRQQYLEQISDGNIVTIQGEIYKKEFKNEQYTYYLRNCYIALPKENVACNHVITTFSSDIYPINKILILQGKVNMFSEATNEGEFDLRSFYQSQKIDFGLRDAEVLEVYGRDHSVAEQLYQLREYLAKVPEKILHEENAGVLSGMLLGEKSKIDSKIKTEYKNSGISHILAISALHISIFAMGMYRLLRKKGGGFAAAALCSGAFVECYAVLTGNSVSTQRAVAMFVLMMLAAVAARSYDMLNALGIWLFLALWKNPFLYRYAGFVFSVTAVLGIGFTVQALGSTVDAADAVEWDEENVKLAKIKRWKDKLKEDFVSGVGIQITTLPVVAFYYYEIPTYAVFLNLLVIPLLAVVLVSGVCGIVAGLYCIPLAKVLVFPADVILSFYRWLCRLTLHLPYSQIIVGKPSAGKLLIYYLVLGIFIWLTGRRKESVNRGEKAMRQGKKAVYQSWQMAAGCFLLLFVLYYHPAIGEEIDMLDVGQGDAVFVSTPDNAAFFIDGGSTSASNVGAYRILPFLKSKGIARIEGWFISHADEDHVNGVEEVLAEGYPVNYLVLAAAMPKDEAYGQLAEAAKQNGTKLIYMNVGDKLGTKEGEFLCLFPETEGTNVSAAEQDAGTLDRNKYCLTLLYRSARLTCLFPGDISAEEEAKLLESPLLAPVDVYKAAHHGSKYSSSAEFLQKLSPQIALVSCGLYNSYGHPGEEAVKNMQDAGAEVCYTMTQGRIRVRPDGKGGVVADTFLKFE